MSTDEFHPRQTPWQLHEADFHELESFHERVKFLLQYAVLAPSSHNTQPWLFRVVDDGVQVSADYSRRLPVVDPRDRELLMSVGAAITNLRVASAWFGYETTVIYERRSEESRPVAYVAFRETCAPAEELRKLFPAIRRRHTNRAPFDKERMDTDAVNAICAVVDRHAETLRLIRSQDHPAIASFIADGDRKLMGRPAVRAELADWMRPNDTERGDGMCIDSVGLDSPFLMTDWVIRNLNIGESRARRDGQLVDNAAALVVVASDDDRVSLVQAGEILELLLLTITLHEAQYSFLNQPVEVAELRTRLQSLTRTAKLPQLLLRIGYAKKAVRPAPRRPVAAVVEG
jgi:nitroreductase